MNPFSEPEWSSSKCTTQVQSRLPSIEISLVAPSNGPRPKSSPSTLGQNFEGTYAFRQEDSNNYPTFPSPQHPNKPNPYFGDQNYSCSLPIPQVPAPIALGQVSMQMLQQQQHNSVELNEEETLLLKLKNEENLPWKVIAARFESDLGKKYKVPALQTRLQRLRQAHGGGAEWCR
jgi:hypothetical protein